MSRRKPPRPAARPPEFGPRRVPPEREVQGAIVTWLAIRGCKVFRRNVAGAQKLKGGHYVAWGSKGQADLWGVLPDGRHFELEVKRPGERPTDRQVTWLLQMNGHGADRSVALWADSEERARDAIDKVIAGHRVVYTHKPRPGDYVLEPPPS